MVIVVKVVFMAWFTIKKQISVKIVTSETVNIVHKTIMFAFPASKTLL